jgi:DNA polymerase-3 subunit delta'
MKRAVEWLQKWGADLALAGHGLAPRYFQGEGATIGQLAAATTQLKSINFNRLLVKFKAQSEHPLNARLVLEELFFAYRALFN